MKKSNTGFYQFVAILLIGASFYFSWKFILPKAEKAKGDIASYENQANAAQVKLDSIAAAKTDLAEMGDLTDRLFLAVPPNKDAPNLLTELETIFQSLKIETPTIQITSTSGDPNTGAATNVSTVSFSIDGTFEQFNVLIQALEKDIRFSNIKSMDMTATEQGGMSMTIQLDVYNR